MTIASPPPGHSAWLSASANHAHADFRLVCFPYAGAGANIFNGWYHAYGPRTSVCAVEYPGRWSRHREPAMKEIPQLVSGALLGLRDVVHGRFAFFGYSLGALVAFELARELRRRGLPGPEHLFVAARGAPQLNAQAQAIHHLPDAQFLLEMDRRYGGIPEAVRRDPDLLALLLPPLRADMTAFENYRYTPEPAFHFPITVFLGENDRRVKPHDGDAWREQTTAGFECHVLPGDHFVLNQSAPTIQGIITRTIDPGR